MRCLPPYFLWFPWRLGDRLQINWAGICASPGVVPLNVSSPSSGVVPFHCQLQFDCSVAQPHPQRASHAPFILPLEGALQSSHTRRGGSEFTEVIKCFMSPFTGLKFFVCLFVFPPLSLVDMT